MDNVPATAKSWWQQNTPEVNAGKKLAIGIGVVGALVILGRVLGMALVGAVNALLLVPVAIAGIVLINVAPWISRVLTMKGKNFLLKSMKQEAMNNPIETRQNIWFENGRELQVAEQNLAQSMGDIESYRNDVAKAKRDFPEADLSDMESTLKAMEDAAGQQERALKDAKQAHAEQKRLNDLLAVKWNAAITSEKIMVALGVNNPKALLDKLMADLAGKTVDTRLNTSMAALRLAMTTAPVKPGEATGPKLIEGQTISTQPLQTPTRQRVPRGDA